MQSLQTIKHRLRSVKNIGQITKAMELVVILENYVRKAYYGLMTTMANSTTTYVEKLGGVRKGTFEIEKRIKTIFDSSCFA
ncbi:MAG: hypothetical protein A3J55_00745 [Candidatus Ryanbacteria bacterium RIFCSPHIGHO2_02_FULL_45_17b]|uniref:Uncharacterized protein n=1 Tax=Candidatus Ryanbacteria bacterium RIFCSPHIGHO2_01_FULL_45_22 TaxID=1802114 RepID=A0A1G2G0W7_9BACT|nr:MAG: hypothetical protein A2719_03210 [Candidatus Ryanbacteria bacterium RIFCSPHIGHO2_01_FULL_45_22]OGZ47071.1 MAG: hypothetical protein A3J55_00745 [Candidatus Ryanbacteria bacterium RIFCSPHIGHO2_02_FULL_45_17b]